MLTIGDLRKLDVPDDTLVVLPKEDRGSAPFAHKAMIGLFQPTPSSPDRVFGWLPIDPRMPQVVKVVFLS